MLLHWSVFATLPLLSQDEKMKRGERGGEGELRQRDENLLDPRRRRSEGETRATRGRMEKERK